jgi:hypothetical protein
MNGWSRWFADVPSRNGCRAVGDFPAKAAMLAIAEFNLRRVLDLVR